MTATATNTANTGHIDPTSIPSVESGTGDTTTTREDTPTLAPSGLCRFEAYDPKSPTAAKLGGRVISLCYKSKKDTATGAMLPPAHTNSCIEVPVLATDDVMAAMPSLLPHVVVYLEGIQDAIAKAAHMEGSESLNEGSFGIAAIVERLEATSSGSRMSKDQLEAWFDEDVADNLMVVFADKLKFDENMTEEQEEKLTAIVGVYKSRLCALAGPKTFYKPADVENLTKAINLAEATETVFGMRLLARLAKMLESTNNADILLAL